MSKAQSEVIVIESNDRDPNHRVVVDIRDLDAMEIRAEELIKIEDLYPPEWRTECGEPREISLSRSGWLALADVLASLR